MHYHVMLLQCLILYCSIAAHVRSIQSCTYRHESVDDEVTYCLMLPGPWTTDS